MSTNRNKTTMCNICGKVTRDDYLKRHMSAKHGDASEIVQHGKKHQDPLQVSVETDAQDDQHEQANNPTKSSSQEDELLAEMDEHAGEFIKTSKANHVDVDVSLEYELVRNNDVYLENLSIGEQISLVLNSGKIMEKSLSKQHKFCLDLFRAQQPTVDVANAELRLWQMQLLDKIDDKQLDDRQIIWVKGQHGNEGKSWFQSYVQSLYGAHRVARFDITNKTADLLHIMSRCPLETSDIFLFNHQRCVSSEECCYSLLEMIKDGYASAPKFHGSLLRIKKPNLIIVFSNRDPRMRSLSKDRWKIYFITSDGLTANHEDYMWKRQADDHTVAAVKNSKKFYRK